MSDPIVDVLVGRGNTRQRVNISGVAHTSSVLAQRLLQLWSWGLLSAPLVQWLAEGAVKDGSTHTDMEQLSRVGSGGAFPGNCRRDLLRYITKSHRYVFNPMPIDIHMLTRCMMKEESAGILSPCEVVETVFEHHRQFVDKALAHDVNKFWDSIDDNDPRLRNHPMKSKPRWRERAIPKTLHGDGAQFVKIIITA